MSETALKAREHHSMHALIVRSYAMIGSLSLTIDTFLVLNFGNEFNLINKKINFLKLKIIIFPIFKMFSPFFDELIINWKKTDIWSILKNNPCVQNYL